MPRDESSAGKASHYHITTPWLPWQRSVALDAHRPRKTEAPISLTRGAHHVLVWAHPRMIIDHHYPPLIRIPLLLPNLLCRLAPFWCLKQRWRGGKRTKGVILIGDYHSRSPCQGLLLADPAESVSSSRIISQGAAVGDTSPLAA